jgi:hypothetical protein
MTQPSCSSLLMTRIDDVHVAHGGGSPEYIGLANKSKLVMVSRLSDFTSDGVTVKALFVSVGLHPESFQLIKVYIN